MICVSVGRGRHKHTIAEHQFLADEGFELVELRLDFIRTDVNLTRLIKDRPCPAIITCRRKEEGGRFSGTEAERQTLLRTAITSGIEYVDLEEDIAGKIPRFGKTKRIVSLHDFEKTPDDLDAVHARLAALDADVVKIATMANSIDDCIRMIRLVREKNKEIPTVAFCMGDIGAFTRILIGKYGAPWTYASMSNERTLAPGQISFNDMRYMYRYDEINECTEFFGVIADPVGHSLSPLIHNSAFANMKMNRVYLPLRILPEDLPTFLDSTEELNIKGISVTIPHKEAVIPKLTQADQAVREIGACNTMIFDGAERLGYNTDYRAAIMSMENAVGGNEASKESPLAGRTALILGSGGVGKAIAFGLIQRGVKVVLTDIDADRASELAERFDCDICDWNVRHAIRTDILVNCTPVGMHPKVDDSPYDKAHMHTDMIVFDAVYNPENTLFIKYAKEKGCTTVTGVDMFVLQALLQFKLFTGQNGPAKLMRDVIKRATSAAKF